MKHIKIFDNYIVNNHIIVNDIIEKYGDEGSAKFLEKLLKGKTIRISNGYETKPNYGSHADVIGIIKQIFFISTSGFIIARLKYKRSQDRDVEIHRSEIFCNDVLDFESAEIVAQSKKYNI